MTGALASLRVGGVALVLAAFGLGLASAALWTGSNARWAAHLDAAEFAGAVLYDALQSGGRPPEGVTVSVLPLADQSRAERGRFDAIAGVPRPSTVTNLSIRPALAGPRPPQPLVLAVLSPDLRYPLADLASRADQTPAEAMGALTRLLATYCSEPLLVARLGQAPWVRIDGAPVWHCAAAPADLRLAAAALGLLSIGALFTLVQGSAAQFAGFAARLRARKRLGGPEAYDREGLAELREIVDAVNAYLAAERDRLAERTAVLSGVSHDLGTPATRLKLRTALIQDPDLRARLDGDIDAMTGIIESVLTFTRAELDTEPPRELSLTALLEALVADYQDVGAPVDFRGAERLELQGAPSLFMSRRGSGAAPEDDKVVVTARPVALTRAVTNLVDNALKYGRRATIGLERDADRAVVTVEDAGASLAAEELDALRAPYARGANVGATSGYGLGLTIVSAIAELHGGELGFEPGQRGLKARLTILRRQ